MTEIITRGLWEEPDAFPAVKRPGLDVDELIKLAKLDGPKPTRAGAVPTTSPATVVTGRGTTSGRAARRVHHLVRGRKVAPKVVVRVVARTTGRTLLYGTLGTARATGHLWRWVRADDYGAHIGTKPEMVEKIRRRRRLTLAWTGGPAALSTTIGAFLWTPTPYIVGTAVFGTAAAAEWWRRRPKDGGPALLTGRMGSKAVREAFAASKLGAVRVVGPVARDGGGWTCVVELPAGIPASKAVRRRAEIASAFGVDTVQVVTDPLPGHAGRLTLIVFDTDPYQGTAPAHPLLSHTGPFSLWTMPVPVGTDARQQPVAFSLVERSVLIGGEPGGGKSVAANNLLAAAALDPHAELWLANGKGSADLLDWEPLAVRSDPDADPDVYLEMIRDLLGEMERRYALLRKLKERKLTREVADGEGMPMVVFHADELAFYVAGNKAVAESLRDLVARGRAAGIVTSVATQRPSADVVPTSLRDLLSVRLALRCTTPQASDTVLGAGWSGRGFSAAVISPEQRGVGVLLAEGSEPVMVRGHFLTDAQVSGIARRATALRKEAGTLPTLDTDPRAVLLRSVLDIFGERRRIMSAELVDKLDQAEDAEHLADLLRPFGVAPGTLWIDGAAKRGYEREHVESALDAL
ncbi:FtsK/SpoIIIE domain-containing protein [Yinghuangia sp. YIM S10712]|uniref:FtsK/SpoIIIE domain-containing protein n=1 Tax=Yinghuangia sp. YIM S10712 TaxID=3436930 RepID=UPI003F536524